MARAATLADNKREYMLTAPMRRLIPAMAIPTIASLMINSIYNLADTYFVSTLGTYATGAVGVNASIDNIIMMAGSFLAAGASSYVSRLLGAKKDEQANRVASTAFFTALMTGTLILIIGLLFMEPLVRVLGATDRIMGYALDYAGYVFYAAPIMASTFVLVHCLRAEGSSTLALIGMAVGAVLNIILDPIFIMVFQWGVKGASAATALSKLVSFIILIIPYLRRRTVLHLHIRNVSYTADVVPEILKMGSPSLFRSGLSTISAIVLNKIAGGYSESALAAISVCNRIMMVPFAMCLGFGQGYQPISGFSFGAKRYDRVKQAFRFATIVSVVGMALVSGVLFLFAPQVIGMFTEADQKLMELGELCLRLQCVAMPFHAWCVVVNMLCVSRGRALSGTILSVSRQGICFFPVLPVLIALWGEWGVAAIQAVADGLSVLIALPIAIRAMREVNALLAASGTEAEAPAAEDTSAAELTPVTES